MHTTEIGTANVPAFLTKLWKLVEDPMYNDLITWSPNGRSFIIKNQSSFSKQLLPLYFKHNNMASFIRQLNMYGFRKLTSIENSGLKSEKDEMEFYHQYFLKGQESYLEYIKRKMKSSQSVLKTSLQVTAPGKPGMNGEGENPSLKGDDYKDILTDVRAIRDRQDSAENCLVQMQRENSALWREIAVLRQKHQKQQQIVDRLIHFLVTLVHNQRNVSVKRKAPLMIDGIDGITSAKRLPPKDPSAAIGGPVIHDVTNDIIEAELEAAANNNPIISIQGDFKDLSPTPGMEESTGAASVSSPFGIPEASPVGVQSNEGLEALDILDPSLIVTGDDGASSSNMPGLNLSASPGPATPKNMAATNGVLETPILLSVPSPSTPRRSSPGMEVMASTSGSPVAFTKETFSDHLEGVDMELDWLQDQLSVGGLNIDSNSLLGLFSSEGDAGISSGGLRPEILGNEVTQYMPTGPLLEDLLDSNDIPSDMSGGRSTDGELDVDQLLGNGAQILKESTAAGNHE